jgi:IclR family pca regulon transcriptional regulator
MIETKPIPVEVAKRDLIESLITGIDVITAFNDGTPHLTPSELAKRIDISRSAARRYLLTLVHAGFAETDGKTFWLTTKVLNLGRSYLDSARLPRAMVPFLQRLTHQIGESTNFSVLDGNDVVYVAHFNAPKVLSPSFEPGARLPAYITTAGRVLLAALPDAELRAWLEKIQLVPYTHLTLLDKDKLYDGLATIRNQGYGITENQFEIGLRGVSVPIKSRSGMVVGAISVSMNVASCSAREAVARCLPALQATANTLMVWI